VKGLSVLYSCYASWQNRWFVSSQRADKNSRVRDTFRSCCYFLWFQGERSKVFTSQYFNRFRSGSGHYICTPQHHREPTQRNIPIESSVPPRTVMFSFRKTVMTMSSRQNAKPPARTYHEQPNTAPSHQRYEIPPQQQQSDALGTFGVSRSSTGTKLSVSEPLNSSNGQQREVLAIILRGYRRLPLVPQTKISAMDTASAAKMAYFYDKPTRASCHQLVQMRQRFEDALQIPHHPASHQAETVAY